MISRLFSRELSRGHELCHQGVVLGYLADGPVIDPVDPAVPDARDVRRIFRDQSYPKGGAHVRAVFCSFTNDRLDRPQNGPSDKLDGIVTLFRCLTHGTAYC